MSTSGSAACELTVTAARSASTSEFAVSLGSVKAAAYASIIAACRLYAYYAIVPAAASKLIHGDNTEFQAERDLRVGTGRPQ